MDSLKLIKEYWFIFLAIVSLIIGWATMQSDSRLIVERVYALEQKVETLNKDRETMLLEIRSVSKDVTWIRAALSGYDIKIEK